jgi:hypothetical protein
MAGCTKIVSQSFAIKPSSLGAMYTASCPAPQGIASGAPSAMLRGPKLKGWY